MLFSAAIVSIFALNILVDAVPVPVSGNSGANPPTVAGPSNTENTKVNSDYREVTVVGKIYKTANYPAGPDRTRRPNAMDIMTDPQFKGIGGAYIATPGKLELELLQAVGNHPIQVDHTAEVQLMSQFSQWLEDKKKWSKDKIEGILLANHDPALWYKANKPLRDLIPHADYKSGQYEGSLLQHVLYQFGNSEKLTRLNVLTTALNNRKGKLWEYKSGSTDTSLDGAYAVMQLDEYQRKASKSFCETIDGIQTVFKRFREERNKAVKPTEGGGPPAAGAPVTIPLRPGAKLQEGKSGKAPAAATPAIVAAAAATPTPKPAPAPSTPQRPIRPQRNQNKTPPNYKLTLDGEKTPEETPLKDQKDRLFESQETKPSGDVVHLAMAPPYNNPMDIPLDDLWVEFIKLKIPQAEATFQNALKSYETSTDKEVMAKKDVFAKYIFTFPAKFLECSSLNNKVLAVQAPLGTTTPADDPKGKKPAKDQNSSGSDKKKSAGARGKGGKKGLQA